MYLNKKCAYKNNSLVIRSCTVLPKLILCCIKQHYVIFILRLLIPVKKGLYKIDKNLKSRYYKIKVLNTSLQWRINMLGYQNDKEYI